MRRRNPTVTRWLISLLFWSQEAKNPLLKKTKWTYDQSVCISSFRLPCDLQVLPWRVTWHGGYLWFLLDLAVGVWGVRPLEESRVLSSHPFAPLPHERISYTCRSWRLFLGKDFSFVRTSVNSKDTFLSKSFCERGSVRVDLILEWRSRDVKTS